MHRYQKKKEIKSRSRLTESEQNDRIQSENQNLETDRRTTHENLARVHQTTGEVDNQIPIKSTNVINELKSGHHFGEIT